MLNDEAVFGVLEHSDEEPADQTEDENVALHDGIEKEYIPAWSKLWLTRLNSDGREPGTYP